MVWTQIIALHYPNADDFTLAIVRYHRVPSLDNFDEIPDGTALVGLLGLFQRLFEVLFCLELGEVCLMHPVDRDASLFKAFRP